MTLNIMKFNAMKLRGIKLSEITLKGMTLIVLSLRRITLIILTFWGMPLKQKYIHPLGIKNIWSRWYWQLYI